MQTKSRNPKLFGMTVFEIGLLVGLGLIACVVIGLAVFILYSNRNRQAIAPPVSTVLPTYTPYPTYTPLPTPTPVAANLLEPTATLPSVATSGSVKPLGVIKVNSWSLEILEIHSDAGKDNTRQVIVVLANLTNEGTGTDTFVVTFNVLLKDSQGRLYEEDWTAGFAAQDKYQTEYSASISPGATAYISFAYDVPASEKSFSLVPGDLASGWSGDVSITVP